MIQIAENVRGVLLPFLAVAGSLLGLLFVYLFIYRGVRDLAWRRRQVLVARYQPLTDAIALSGLTSETGERLRHAVAAHRRIVAGLLLAPLRATRGDAVARVREASVATGLVDLWLTDARDRRWWRRADGVRALGFIEEPSALAPVLHALEDDHEEVRAAAVEAAGRLGDPRAIPALLGHMADSARYQRTRVIDALRSLGELVTPALVESARAHPDRTRLAVDVLGMIGTAAAIDPLIDWCGDARWDVRAAALGALGSIGLNDRSYYFALRGLRDADPRVRAMAARALGRSRREEAADDLAARLDDDWLPAAQAAGALRLLGGAGVAALKARASDQGQAGDLARQVLWSLPPSVARS